MAFTKATKHQLKLRMAIVGPAGAGKTFTALKIAARLGNRVAVIDSERGSARLYADRFNFDVDELQTGDPHNYITSIKEADRAGYDVLVIDGLSQAWAGKGGALEMKDNISKRSQSGNSFTAWREVTPLHNELVDTMLTCNCHIICTLRAKMEYVQEQNDKGKTVIRKVGMAPIQREGLEYEFAIVGDMTVEHDLIISKSRCSDVENQIYNKPGNEFTDVVKAWLESGDAAPSTEEAKPEPQQPKQQAEKPKTQQPVTMASEKQCQLSHILGAQKYGTDKQNPGSRAEFLELVSAVVGRTVKSTKELTSAEISKVIDEIQTLPDYKEVDPTQQGLDLNNNAA